MLEIQERETAAYGFKKKFSEIISYMRAQQVDKSLELRDPRQKVTLNDL